MFNNIVFGVTYYYICKLSPYLLFGGVSRNLATIYLPFLNLF